MLQHATLTGFCLVSSLGPFFLNNFPSLFLSFSVLLIRLFIYFRLCSSVFFFFFFICFVLYFFWFIPFFSPNLLLFFNTNYIFYPSIFPPPNQTTRKLKCFLPFQFSTPSIKWTTTLVLSFCLHLSQIRIVTKIEAQK